MTPQTELRNLRREHKRVREALTEALRIGESYRGRATKAEQETAEWKRRFDALLERTPKGGEK